jgi:arylsulfatase A-like enzyme
MKYKFRPILGLLTIGLTVYLAVGFSRWLLQCTAHRYFQQGLQDLAALELVIRMNRYGLAFAACALGIGIILFFAGVTRNWLSRALLRIEVVHKLRAHALVLSLGLLAFLTGLAAVLDFEASLASASTTSPPLSEVIRGMLALFSRSSSLNGAMLFMLIYSCIACVFVCTATIALSHWRVFSQGERTNTWIGSPLLCVVGSCELFLLVALNTYAWWGARSAASDGSNVILISIDTLRADHLQTYGYARKTAPNIAKLAAAGIVFTNAYSQAPWTLPSMASLHTGLYPYQHGALTLKAAIPDEVTTLAETFKNNSYFTIGVTSAWFASRAYGFAQGFDIFDESHIAGADSVTSQEITDATIRYLRHNQGKRFFVWVHYFDSHAKYIRHPKYGYADGYSGLLTSGLAPNRLNRVKDHLQPEDRQYILDVYDEEITFIDEAIGRLLQALQDMGLTDRTVIVLTADHGEEFLERGNIGHGTRLYEELIHVPLAIVGDKTVSFHCKEEPVETRWVGRTILDLCGLRKNHFPGIDLLQSPKGSEHRDSGLIFSEGSHAEGSDGRLDAAVTPGWKLIHSLENGSYELYDLQEDHQERHNLFLAGTQEQRQVGAFLARELNRFRSGTRAAAKSTMPNREELDRLRSLGYIR